IYKALYPSNRWRDYHDFNQVTLNRATECWLAPDGKTIIPVCYDLARACAMSEAFPGKHFFAVDEYDKRTVKCQADAMGYLSDLNYFTQKGEFSSVPDRQGNVWVADGDIWVFDAAGKPKQSIHVPERPSTLVITESLGTETIYFTGRTAFYKINKSN
ncbi:MAG TPA: hypothetical protein VKI61_04240, partial [Chitinophagaceae bacterium]|nr:hypothetical protein [Chitinophagaceae bacterium]